MKHKEASQAAKQLAEIAKIAKDEEVLWAAVEVFSNCSSVDVIASIGHRMLMHMQQTHGYSSPAEAAGQIRRIGMAALETGLMRE